MEATTESVGLRFLRAKLDPQLVEQKRVDIDALFDAPQLMPVGNREFRVKRLESQQSTLFSMKLRRNKEVSADEFHALILPPFAPYGP